MNVKNQKGSLLLEYIMVVPIGIFLISSLTINALSFGQQLRQYIQEYYIRFLTIEFLSSLRLDLLDSQMTISNSSLILHKNNLSSIYEIKNNTLRKQFQVYHPVKQRVITHKRNFLHEITDYKLTPINSNLISIRINHPHLDTPFTIPFSYSKLKSNTIKKVN